MMRFTVRLLFLIVCLSTYSAVALSQDNFITISQQQIDNLGIKIGKLETVSQVPMFTAPAKVVIPPAHDFVVSTNQAGLVVKMNAAVGDKVTKGQDLAVINSPDLLTLQGNYLQAIGALKLASATYNRDLTLRKEGVISGRNEQASYSAYNAAQVEANKARQLLQMAGLNATELKQLTNSGRLINQISIKSPITGQVIERMVTTGGHVDSLSPLYRVANLDELWLEINIPQDHIDDINIGDKVQVENSAAAAVIKLLGQSIHPENQTLLARAVIRENPSSVRVGQKVTIQHLQASDAVTYKLPDAAIAHNGGKTYVFIRDKEGFKVSQITMLGKQADVSVITGIFSGNEDIAINNASALKAIMMGLGSDE